MGIVRVLNGGKGEKKDDDEEVGVRKGVPGSQIQTSAGMRMGRMA